MDIYSNCPLNYVIDHIIPLNGKDVSGLNVPWNLQYLMPETNRFKSNHTYELGEKAFDIIAVCQRLTISFNSP